MGRIRKRTCSRAKPAARTRKTASPRSASWCGSTTARNLSGREGMPRGLSLLDLTALDAVGADAHALGSALHARAHRAQVHVPAPLAHVVRVADVVAELRPFAANITDLCHDGKTPEVARDTVAKHLCY